MVVGFVCLVWQVRGGLARFVQVGGTHFDVMCWRVVLALVVGKIGGSRLPVHFELALFGSVLDPIEAHIDGFGSLLFDCVISDVRGSAVVGLDRGWWLIVAQFFETGSNKGAGFFSVVEQCAEFSFGDAGNDFAEDLA